MAGAVFLVCAATALVCSMLLYRSYRRTKLQLLLWSSICFGLLAVENLLLFLDLILMPDINLFFVRTIVALLAVSVLIIGLTSPSN